MKKCLTKEYVIKKLAKAAAKHDARELELVKRSKRQNWSTVYTPKPYAPDIKYYKRLHVFKTQNNIFDPVKMTAYSYNWWRYLEIIKGKLVFNDYSYSQQTNRHKSNLRGVLSDLGIKIDAVVYLSRGLQSLATSLPDKYESIFQLQTEITKGREGTWAQQNRYATIRDLKKEIKILRSLGAKMSLKSVKELEKQVWTKFTTKEIERKKEIADKKAFIRSTLVNTDLFDLNQNQGVQQ